MADQLDFRARIDWNQPWLAPLRDDGEPLCHPQENWRSAINAIASARATVSHQAQPIAFVAQSELPDGVGYEAFISATGRVPTRDNLHDFFNALVWLNYPLIKIRLNALQAIEVRRRQGVHEPGLAPGVGMPVAQQRGSLRDALTIFDENAAVVATTDLALLGALRAHQWTTLFIDRRDAFASRCEVCLFGHALLQKLVTPYKAITAHAWPVVVPAEFFSLRGAAKKTWLDRLVSAQLDDTLRTSAFTPLPVFGVPGWNDGQTPAFYEDQRVFRPPRQQS